ncbi:hypothetical protein GGR56DRAFT_296672 [Xylariaceae sp. FL0804]|nr:hypothetical protein GGR56DRAFT_296672 [Xylariaceae sp. FL0804]
MRLSRPCELEDIPRPPPTPQWEGGRRVLQLSMNAGRSRDAGLNKNALGRTAMLDRQTDSKQECFIFFRFAVMVPSAPMVMLYPSIHCFAWSPSLHSPTNIRQPAITTGAGEPRGGGRPGGLCEYPSLWGAVYLLTCLPVSPSVYLSIFAQPRTRAKLRARGAWGVRRRRYTRQKVFSSLGRSGRSPGTLLLVPQPCLVFPGSTLLSQVFARLRRDLPVSRHDDTEGGVSDAHQSRRARACIVAQHPARRAATATR